jgi:hypothetical protein
MNYFFTILAIVLAVLIIPIAIILIIFSKLSYFEIRRILVIYTAIMGIATLLAILSKKKKSLIED